MNLFNQTVTNYMYDRVEGILIISQNKNQITNFHYLSKIKIKQLVNSCQRHAASRIQSAYLQSSITIMKNMVLTRIEE